MKIDLRRHHYLRYVAIVLLYQPRVSWTYTSSNGVNELSIAVNDKISASPSTLTYSEKENRFIQEAPRARILKKNGNTSLKKEWQKPKSKASKKKLKKGAENASGKSKSLKEKSSKSSKKKSGTRGTPTISPTIPTILLQPTRSPEMIRLWSQLGNTIRGEAPDDEAGRSVSLSSDGLVLAIGAPFNGNPADGYYKRGHVRIYEWNNNTNSWAKKGHDIDGAAAGDFFGEAVVLSSDGNMIAVGAPENDEKRGYVSLYKWDEEQGVPKWTQIGNRIEGENEGDFSGQSVALSLDGKIIAIGASGSGDNRGHARIYTFNENQSDWFQLGQDIDGEANNDLSGLPVSLSSNGKIIAIGASSNDGSEFNSDSGHVRVYEWNESTLRWTQIGSDIDGKESNSFSGTSVSLSGDGTIVAVGAPKNEEYYRGAVRVYKWNGAISSWTQMGNDIDGGDKCDLEGNSVALSENGEVVVIGAPFSDSNGFRSGQVRVYKWDYDTADWSLYGFGVGEGEIGDGEDALHQFGYAVSVSSSGTVVAVGAPFNSGFGNVNNGYVKAYSLASP